MLQSRAQVVFGRAVFARFCFRTGMLLILHLLAGLCNVYCAWQYHRIVLADDMRAGMSSEGTHYSLQLGEKCMFRAP